MTREDLMQAAYIEKEIELWEERLGEEGISQELRAKLGERLDALKKQRDSITEFILAIDDCQTRLIFGLRCLDSLSWNAVADRVGGMNSEYTVKKRFYRYLEKKGA